MPIDAKFTADFSQFATATKGAQSELDKLITKSDGAAKSIGKMSDAAAGRFSVTTAEMKKAGFATQDWTKDLSRFDGVLGAVGVNISSQVRAITELSAAAGQTATSMGLLGTAGLAAGAAIAGWQLGRFIADLFDLDTKIANLNGSLDRLKAQEKGAGLDVLAAASRIAKREITDMAEALRIVNQQQADNLLVTGRSANAAGEAGKAYARMFGELRAVRERGDMPALERDLKSYDFSLQTLSTRYGVHTDALEYHRKHLKAVADEEKERAKALEANKAALDKLIAADWAGVLKGQTTELLQQNPALQQSIDLLNQRVAAEWAAQKALSERLGFDEQGNRLTEAGSVEALTAAYEKEKAALEGVGASVAELDLLYLNYQDAVLQTGGAMQEAGNKTAASGNQAQQAAGQYAALGQAATYVAGSFQNMWTQVGHGAGYEGALRSMNDMFSEYSRAGVPVFGGLVPGSRATGGPVASNAPYWVGERGPELFVPKTSGSIVPAGATGGVTVNVYGSVLSTQRELATLVEEAMMRTYRQGGNRQPV